MRNQRFKKWVQTEMEREASALERQTEEDRESREEAGVEMPANSYDDLQRRMEGEAPKKKGQASAWRRPRLAVAVVALLVVAAGLGTSGAKLFVPVIEELGQDGEENVGIESDIEFYHEASEAEAYEEIEEKLGILALRLGYKPQGMELEKVFIDEELGEALMEFSYKEFVFSIYENKQNDNASFNVLADGMVVDRIELFFNEQELEIVEIGESPEEKIYQAQFVQGNAYYYVSGTLELQEFEKIISEMFFENV